MENQQLQTLFEKYIRNTATEEEVRIFLKAVKKGDADELLKAYTLSYQNKESSIGSKIIPDTSSIWKKTEEQRNLYIKQKKRKIIFLRTMAAAVILLAGCLLFFKYASFRGSVKDIKYKYASLSNAVYYDRSIRLPDSSAIILHKGSSLRVSDSFNMQEREVFLNGEAYFDVTHLEHKAFIIHTGSISIRVLGTAFNVNAYAKADSSAVMVTRGKVAVYYGNHNEYRILKSGEYAIFSGQKSKIVHNGSSIAQGQGITEWTAEDLNFNGTTMGEVCDILSKRYGVRFEVKDSSLLDYKVKISFSGKEKLENMLASLTVILNIRSTVKDSTVYLLPIPKQ